MRGRGIRLVLTCGLVWFLGSPGWAQPSGGQVQQMRQQLQSLQEQLSALESGQPERPRVTQLGSTRAPVEEKEPELIVRIYDLSDLFTVAPPYPAYRSGDLRGPGPFFAEPFFPVRDGSEPKGGGAMGMGGMGGGMGGMGGGMYSVPAPAPGPQSRPRDILPQMFAGGSVQSPRTSMDDLIDAITSTIEPTQWDQVGGPAAIARLGTALLISATSRMHEQIETLLDSFRKRWGTLRTVSIEADWLWLTKPQLTGLLAAWKPKPGVPTAFGLVDETAWQKLGEPPAKDAAPPRAGYHAVITCYNGQVAHVISGGQSLAVVGMIPVIGSTGPLPLPSPPAGEKGKFGIQVPVSADSFVQSDYHPQMAILQDGAVLQVMPIASISGKYVAVDVHSRVAQVTPAPPAAGAGGPGGAAYSPLHDLVTAIDRPRLAVQHLETTLRIPADHRMLVGGMTFQRQPELGSANLYLFLRVTVQELRDEVAQRDTQAQPNLKVPAQLRPPKVAKPAPTPKPKPSPKARTKTPRSITPDPFG